jgi:hypothetical protein
MRAHLRPGACVLALVVVVLASVTFGASGASAGRLDPPGHGDANQCFNSLGVDLNELYGISDQFRTRECQEVTAGEHWILLLVWITDDGVDNVYPAGYVPSRATPMEDFLAKLVAYKVVVDGGTPQEFTQVFSPSEVRTDINDEQLEPGRFEEPLPVASMLARMRPLSVGDHTFQPFIMLSAQHCDGLGADVEENCLPAGEIPFGPPRPLTVTAPAE